MRIYVQVDLDASLPRSILIGGFRQDILYEGIGSLCFSCGKLRHRKNLCPYTVKELVAERDNTDVSELRRQDDEVAESINPEGKVTGEEKGDYGPWMPVGHKKQGPKSQATCTQPIKSNLEHISTFNAKDLGHFRRFASLVNPPSRPPFDSLDGKRKLGRFDNTGMTDANISPSHEIASDASYSELPKVTCTTSVLKRNDPIGTHTSPFSNSLRFEPTKASPKSK